MTPSSGPWHTVRAKTSSSDFSEAQVKPQSSSPNQSQWSTPVLQVRDRLLLMPVIGGVDAERARGLTEQLLPAIRAYRARVVVIDVAGVPAMDAVVANHLVRTVEAARLLGATVIVTSVSPEIALTLVSIGVALSQVNTMGDLQGGIEEAERLLGYAAPPREGHGRTRTPVEPRRT